MASNRRSYRYSLTCSGIKNSLIEELKAGAQAYINCYPKAILFKHASQSLAQALIDKANRIYNYYNAMDEKDSRCLDKEFLRQLAVWVCEEIILLKASKKTTLCQLVESKTYHCLLGAAQLLFPEDIADGELSIGALLGHLNQHRFAKAKDTEDYLWLEHGFRVEMEGDQGRRFSV